MSITHRVLALVLGAVSATHWILFFAAGRFDMSVGDWPRQSAYFAILRNAIREGRLPLETAQPVFDMHARFVANLEAPLAPHTWVFALAGDHFAVVASAVLMSLIGVYGCYRLARRLGLGPLAFTLMTMLLCFNGSIVAHLSVGHLGWLGCYLLPLAAEALLVIAGGGRSARRAASALALVLFALLLAGSVHIAVITCGLVALCAIAIPAGRVPFALCLAQFALLSMFRLLPAAATFWSGGRLWISDGYTPQRMLEALLLVHEPAVERVVSVTRAYGVREPMMLGWVEIDVYVGLAGVLLLVVFAVAAALRGSAAPSRHEPALRALQVPCLLLAGLSLWRFYPALVVAPVSLLSVERLPGRFLGVALVVAIVIAVARFDAWWRARPRDLSESVAAWAFAGVAAAQLAYHSLTYSPARGALFPVQLPPLDPMLTSVSSAWYLATLVAGAVVSLAALAWSVSRVRPSRSRG